MNAVASSSSTQHDDAVSWLHLARMTAMRQDAETATENQRVIKIALVIEDGSIYRGNAHLIAVVAHTVDYATGNAARRENTFG